MATVANRNKNTNMNGNMNGNREIPENIAIFFDNDEKHIREVRSCPSIRIIKVNSLPYIPPLISYINPSFNSYFGDISAVFMQFIKMVTGGEDHFDKTSGLTSKDAEILHKWIQETADLDERYAIFDFDRTITKIEGINAGSQNKGMESFREYYKRAFPSASAEDVAAISARQYLLYLCGGAERFAMVKSMLLECLENGIRIVILTNNGACYTDKKLFDEFMEEFGVSVDKYTLICSGRPEYRGNKLEALQEELSSVCADTMEGGRRKRGKRCRTRGGGRGGRSCRSGRGGRGRSRRRGGMREVSRKMRKAR